MCVMNQAGITMLAAVFFLVVVALFGLLAVRMISTGTVSSAEGYLNIQGEFSALSGRELRTLYIDRGGASGWAGNTTLDVGACNVTQVAFATANDTDYTGAPVTVSRFSIEASCGAEGEPVGGRWEAVITTD